MVTIKGDYSGDFYVKRAIEPLIDFIKKRKKKNKIV